MLKYDSGLRRALNFCARTHTHTHTHTNTHTHITVINWQPAICDFRQETEDHPTKNGCSHPASHQCIQIHKFEHNTITEPCTLTTSLYDTQRVLEHRPIIRVNTGRLEVTFLSDVDQYSAELLQVIKEVVLEWRGEKLWDIPVHVSQWCVCVCECVCVCVWFLHVFVFTFVNWFFSDYIKIKSMVNLRLVSGEMWYIHSH